MERGGDGAQAGSIRTSADALEQLANGAQREFDRLADATTVHVERMARTIGTAPRLPGGGDPPATLGALAAAMNDILDAAVDDITATVRDEATALTALLDSSTAHTATPDRAGTPTTPTIDHAPVTSPATPPQFREPDLPATPTDHHDTADRPDTPAATATQPAPVPDTDDEPPPLPDLSDIPAPKGTIEWAEAVVARYPRLTTDEVLAIYTYTTVRGVDRINTYLRGTLSLSLPERAELDRLIAHARSGLAKLPKRPGIAFRGTNLPDKVLVRWQIDEVVDDPAFTSSSTEPLVAEGFRKGGNAFITIIGHSGVDVRKLSHFGHEEEILFQPATELRVTDRRWDPRLGCWRLRAEEVTR